MNRDEIRQVVLRSIESVAPEADAASLDPEASLRDELDLDPMDFLNYVSALHEELEVDIPEADYGRVDSVREAVDYLAGKLGIAA